LTQQECAPYAQNRQIRPRTPPTQPDENPRKLEGGRAFVLKTEFEPAGDQPTAIKESCARAFETVNATVCSAQRALAKSSIMAKMIEENPTPRNHSARPTNPRGTAIRRIQRLFFLTPPWNILSVL
jgi:hypothetical protein